MKTELQINLEKEMIEQEIPKDWVYSLMRRLKTPKQQQQMMDYLMTTRDKLIPLNKAILKVIEIKNHKN